MAGCASWAPVRPAHLLSSLLRWKARYAHAGVMVPSRGDLEAWQAHLESKGVVSADVADKSLTQSPIPDGYAAGASSCARIRPGTHR